MSDLPYSCPECHNMVTFLCEDGRCFRCVRKVPVKTCKGCPNLITTRLGTALVASCRETGSVVPQWSSVGNYELSIIYSRVPMDCPRDDTEKRETPLPTHEREVQFYPKEK